MSDARAYIVRTDLLLLLYGVPGRFVVAPYKSLILLYCIVLYHLGKCCSRVWFLIVLVIAFHAIAHACVVSIVSDMRVQLE